MTNNELAQIICECTEILATTTTYAATFLSCDLGTEDCNAAINGMGKMGARLDELRETIKADIQNEEQAKVHHPTTQAYEAALDHIAELKEKNEKLRQLVEDMLSCIEIRSAFNRPPTTKMYEEFAQQARKLGIEVPE